MMTEWKAISIKLDELLLERIDKYAMNHRLYRSEVIRKAIEEFLDNEEYGKFEPTEYAKFRPLTRDI